MKFRLILSNKVIFSNIPPFKQVLTDRVAVSSIFNEQVIEANVIFVEMDIWTA
jgi:hypothetical protein